MIRSTISAISEVVQKQRKITASFWIPLESKCERSGFLFFIARKLLVRGRNFSVRGTLDVAGGRKKQRRVEQGDGDEVHLADGSTDGARGVIRQQE